MGARRVVPGIAGAGLIPRLDDPPSSTIPRAPLTGDSEGPIFRRLGRPPYAGAARRGPSIDGPYKFGLRRRDALLKT